MRVADPCLCALREQSLPSGRLPLDCLARLTFRSASGVVGLVAMDAQGRRRLAMCPSRRVCSGVILYRHCHQIKNKKIKKGDTVVGIRYSNSTHTRHTTGRRPGSRSQLPRPSSLAAVETRRARRDLQKWKARRQNRAETVMVERGRPFLTITITRLIAYSLIH
jgi:hypothetical protein